MTTDLINDGEELQLNHIPFARLSVDVRSVAAQIFLMEGLRSMRLAFMISEMLSVEVCGAESRLSSSGVDRLLSIGSSIWSPSRGFSPEDDLARKDPLGNTSQCAEPRYRQMKTV